MAIWVVQVNPSILGPVVPQARKARGRFIPAAQLPAALRAYLNLPEKQNDRPVMRDFKTMQEIDALSLDENLIRRTARGYSRLLTINLPEPAGMRKPPRVPRNVPAIRSLRQLCAYFGADAPGGLNRRIYKDTACGASISLLVDGEWLHNGSDKLRTLPIDAKIQGFTIQTIVEGSDATVDSDVFLLPAPESSVANWMAEMETEADELWKDANEDQ